MYCSQCGKQMDPAARFCPGCGAAAQPMTYGRAPYPEQLVRPLDSRVIAGVCAGFAQHYRWELSVVRIIAVCALIVSCGTAMVAYFAAWIIIPDAPYAMPERTGAGNAGSGAGI